MAGKRRASNRCSVRRAALWRRRRVSALFLEAKRARDAAAHFPDPWITAPGCTKYRRTRRWLLDPKPGRQAAEMADDVAAAPSAAAEAETLQQRRRPVRRDDAWPSGWDGWPDYLPRAS